jgi:hypothetical protein
LSLVQPEELASRGGPMARALLSRSPPGPNGHPEWALSHGQRTVGFGGVQVTTRGPPSLRGGVASRRDRVLPGIEKVQGSVVLIPDYPPIMPGRHTEEIGRPGDNFRPVYHRDRRAAGDR